MEVYVKVCDSLEELLFRGVSEIGEFFLDVGESFGDFFVDLRSFVFEGFVAVFEEFTGTGEEVLSLLVDAGTDGLVVEGVYVLLEILLFFFDLRLQVCEFFLFFFYVGLDFCDFGD